MCPSAVHKHRGKKGQVYRTRCRLQAGNLDMLSCYWFYNNPGWCHYIVTGQYLLRNGREGIGKTIIRSHTLQEDKDQNIDSNEHISDYRGRTSIRIIVTNR